MPKLTFGMNLSLDAYIAAPGGGLGWSLPSDELFQWWSDRVGATAWRCTGAMWETMRSHCSPGHRRRCHRDQPAQD